MATLSKSISSFAAIFAVILCVIFAVSFAQGCGFTQSLQDQVVFDLARPAPKQGEINPRRAATYAPIRFVVSFLDLDDSSKYCTAAGETKPDMKGGTRTCVAEDVFTSAMRTELKTVIIPKAIALLNSTLSVVPLTSNLVVGSTSQCTGGFTIPASHTTTGVPDADYVLYVAAAPTQEGNVAWAGGCQSTSGSPSRIIVGRANFGPRYLTRSTMPLKDIISTGVHEILHALGYSYSSFNNANMITSMSIRGITKNVITTAKVRDEARKFIGCGSLPGVELENEGGSGTADSHPDRRIYQDDVMAGAGGESLSTITLSVMESLGVYQANYTGAQNMVTGKGLGCLYTTGGCTDNNVFCPTLNVDGCTSNLKAVGKCSAAFLTDSCTYINGYSNLKCYDDSQTDTDYSGDTFHEDSRCYKTQNTMKKTGASQNPPSVFRCFKSQCFGGILSFAIGRSSTNFVTCNAGATATYTGYDGSVICPNVTLMCDSLQSSANKTATNDVLNTITTRTYGKENRASDWIYTTKLTLTVTGSGWSTIINNYYSDLFVAMQGDVAQILDVQSQQVWVTSVSGSSSSVQFVITVNIPTQSSSQVQASFASYLGRAAWMPRTSNLYTSKSGASDSTVLGAAGTTDKPSNICTPYMPSFEDDNKCNGFAAGLAIAAIAFIALIVISIYCCCCKYQPPPNSKDAENGGKKLDRSVKYQVQVKK